MNLALQKSATFKAHLSGGSKIPGEWQLIANLPEYFDANLQRPDAHKDNA